MKVLKELMFIGLIVVASFGVFALLVAAVWGVIDYSVGGPTWQLVAGIAYVLAFSVFYIYMRTHHWK